MKKKLLRFLPLGAISLIAIVVLLVLLRVLLPRYIGVGERTLSLFTTASDGEGTLVQLHEAGLTQKKLGTMLAEPVFSPNGRWAAVTFRKNEALNVTKVYDLEEGGKTSFSLDGNLSGLLLTDEGLLVYRKGSRLCWHNRNLETVMDTRAHPSQMQLLENTVYYFRDVGDGTCDLYACDLPDGTPRRIESDLEPGSLQASLYKGDHYLIAARNYYYEGPLYEQVIDDAGEEKAALRKTLKETTSGEVLTDVYRFVNGEASLLAEGVRYEYQVEPVSGTVVCRFSAFLRPQWALSELEGTYLAERTVWYCTAGGVTAELTRQKEVDPVITPTGEIFLLEGTELLHRASAGAEPQSLGLGVSGFRVLLDENGEQEIFLLMSDGPLVRLSSGETETLVPFATAAYFPAAELPGGALLKTAEHFFYKRVGAAELRAPGEARLVLIITPYDNIFTLFRWEDGVQTPLATRYGIANAVAETRDGQLIADTKSGWLLANGAIGGEGELILPVQTLSVPDWCLLFPLTRTSGNASGVM